MITTTTIAQIVTIADTTTKSEESRLAILKAEFLTLQPAARRKEQAALERLQKMYEETNAMFDSPTLPSDLEVDCGELRKQLSFYLSAMKFLSPIADVVPKKDFVDQKRRAGGKKRGHKAKANLFQPHRSKVTPRKAAQKSTPAKRPAHSKKGSVRYNRSIEEVTPPPNMKRKARFISPTTDYTPLFSIPHVNARPLKARKTRKVAPRKAVAVVTREPFVVEGSVFDFDEESDPYA